MEEKIKMILKNVLALFLLVLCFPKLLQANDLNQVVSGAEVEDVLGSVKATGISPFTYRDNGVSEIDNQKIKKTATEDFNFNQNLNDVSVDHSPKRKFEESGFTIPGTYEKSESFLEIDRKKFTNEFRGLSSGSFNISFFKDDFNYESDNDIINRTISEGYKHVKGGALYLRNDLYLSKTDFLNTFWSVGAGVGYNSGRGIFINGERSDTTFKLWEVPVDIGLGLEIPFYHWFKISGNAGPSVMALMQNRNDLLKGEKGRNKTQVSYGQFANAKFKINLTGFSHDTAYELFVSSKITNLYLNLEARYQNYQNFKDAIKISGTSLGIGFTFEYL
jgi:hypothetical protein